MRGLKPPSDLGLVAWADTYRKVAAKTSATPGQWRTSAQPVSFGPMDAITSPDTHTVSVMAGTQVVKTELDINVACYYVHQEPSPILFVQPTQGAAEAFSKERFAPTVEASPELRELIAPARSRDSDNTITHKSYPGGSLDFVGSNSPTDLASRPKRIIICDEIDKYPPSAGAEGDPLKLAEERASTYHALGRAKFIRTCSPTEKGTSRIGREYAAGDQRHCFVECPECDHSQELSWASVHWEKDKSGGHLPATAGIMCGECGTVWSEQQRQRALAALEHAPGRGWKQMKAFVCGECEQLQTPSIWDDEGRSLCFECHVRSPYNGHASFLISKLYSARHRLPDMVREFLEAKEDPELMRKFTNTCLAELWEPKNSEGLDGTGLISRQENYGPDDLPDETRCVTGFCDVQGDRLEVQAIAWGPDEESWPFLYEVISLDPAQPQAWKELDVLTTRTFTTKGGKTFRFAAFGIDTGGHHGAQVFSFCRTRRGRRIFACKGVGGKRPIWNQTGKRDKNNDIFFPVGVDTAKDAIYSRLKITPPDNPDDRKPGYIHFPSGGNFGPDYFEQLTVERRVTRIRMGQPYSLWVCPPGARNEALDTFVGALAVRRSLPKVIQLGVEFSIRQGPVRSAINQEPKADAEEPVKKPRRFFGPMSQADDPYL